MDLYLIKKLWNLNLHKCNPQIFRSLTVMNYQIVSNFVMSRPHMNGIYNYSIEYII